MKANFETNIYYPQEMETRKTTKVKPVKMQHSDNIVYKGKHVTAEQKAAGHGAVTDSETVLSHPMPGCLSSDGDDD